MAGSTGTEMSLSASRMCERNEVRFGLRMNEYSSYNWKDISKF